jgi:uncharacterized protein GlcG (DUF336 family)
VAVNQEAFLFMSSILTLSSADKAIEAGKAKAAHLGIAFTIAVVGGGSPDDDNEIAEAVKSTLI